MNKSKAITTTCSIVSIGSMAATPFLLTKANSRARCILSAYQAVNFLRIEDAPIKVRAKLTWKCYIPVGIVMGVGMAAAAVSGVVSNKVITSLSAEITAHALTVASSTEVKEKLLDVIQEKYGIDVEKEVRDEVSQSISTHKKGREVTSLRETNSGDVVWLFDETHGRFFRGSVEDVNAAVNNVNAAINHGNVSCLADVYDELGMDSGSIDRSLYPRNEGELFDLVWSSSIYEGQPCAHFGFRELSVQ